MTPRPQLFARPEPPPPPETAHAGLWLDKYIGDQNRDDVKTRHNLILQVAGISTPTAYGAFYDRWRQTLVAMHAYIAEAKVQGRMAVGLGDEGVLETSIQLHHTYGVPFIPGSALKGVAAAYARKRLASADWGVKTPAYCTLFGDPDEVGAGYVTFFDALYVPGSGVQGHALHPDVLTVHHKAYYEGKPQPPADWDSPTPVPFLSATGRYLIAVGGQAEWAAWTDAACSILLVALAELGIGAKTSSGYGRLKVDQATLQRPFPTVVAPQHMPAEPPPAQPVGSASSAARAPAWRPGVVSDYKQGKGRVLDPATGKEYNFGFFAIEAGYTPRKGDRVECETEELDGKRVAVRIRKPR